MCIDRSIGHAMLFLFTTSLNFKFCFNVCACRVLNFFYLKKKINLKRLLCRCLYIISSRFNTQKTENKLFWPKTLMHTHPHTPRKHYCHYSIDISPNIYALWQIEVSRRVCLLLAVAASTCLR